MNQNRTFDPIKDGTLGAASPKPIGVYIWLWCTSVQNLKEIRQEMWPAECTHFHQNNDLWPYKRRNTGGSITKTYRCVDLTMMHICEKIKEIHQEMWPAERTQNFDQNMTSDPIKRLNTGGSITKNKKCVDFTKIHLHTKFERTPSRNAAVRAHTRMWTQNMTFDPIKDGTLGAAVPKTIGV